MRQLPIVRMHARFPRQIGTNPPRAPQVRIFVTRLPGLNRLTPARLIGGNKSHLFRMTVRTTFPTVNDTAARLASREYRHARWRRLLNFGRECASRHNAQDHEGKHEESYARDKCHRVSCFEPARDLNV